MRGALRPQLLEVGDRRLAVGAGDNPRTCRPGRAGSASRSAPRRRATRRRPGSRRAPGRRAERPTRRSGEPAATSSAYSGALDHRRRPRQASVAAGVGASREHGLEHPVEAGLNGRAPVQPEDVLATSPRQPAPGDGAVAAAARSPPRTRRRRRRSAPRADRATPSPSAPTVVVTVGVPTISAWMILRFVPGAVAKRDHREPRRVAGREAPTAPSRRS